jgi:hypothetical protein
MRKPEKNEGYIKNYKKKNRFSASKRSFLKRMSHLQDMLKKQLQRVRFEKAISYIEANAQGKKHLNTQELAGLNMMIRGNDEDPWRSEAAVVSIPGGKHASFAILTNPMISIRNIVSNALQKAMNGDVEDAALDLYSQLVLNHFFKDANRRTAVAATHWLLLERNIHISALGLLEIGIGDIRSEDQLNSLRNLIRLSIEVAKSRS